MVRATPGACATPIHSGADLRFVLRAADGERVLGVEPVKERDLVDAHAEVWLEAFLRRGRTDVAREHVAVDLTPLYLDPARLESTRLESTHRGGEPAGSRPFCAGFALATEGPDGERVERRFPRSTLAPVVQRAVRRLLDSGVLEPGDRYVYELRADARAVDDGASAPEPVAQVRLAGAQPLTTIDCLELPLAPLVAGAELVGSNLPASGPPVLYTRSALARAELVARRGGECEPSVETGGLLVGPLCSCPETGELFAVVTDVLEAAGAESTTYTLTYSGETWRGVQDELRALRADPRTRAHRILGQCHGHCFSPGGEPCAECGERERCSRTTVFLSAEDLAWSRAVFHGEPWQLGHVFGLDARGAAVDALFGQRHGQLTARGYLCVDDFRP